MIKLLFWLFVAVDVAGIGLFYVLGLAAAGSSKTNPVWVTLLLFVLPALLLLVSIVLFLRSSSTPLRALAFAFAAAPLVLLVYARATAVLQFRANSNEQGELTFYTAGPMRDIVEAIRRNDAEAVARLVPQVDVNETGMDDMTLLISALRQLRKTPDQQEVLKVLLVAGADPNKGTKYEAPLQMALQTSDDTGPEPVRLLLEAGADPNARRGVTSDPIFFSSVGNGMGTQMLELMIAHGADVTQDGSDGQPLLFGAANARNWHAVLFLLERGADPRRGRNLSGNSFEEMLEQDSRWASADSGFADVMAFLKKR